MKETMMYCHKLKTTKYNSSFGEFYYADFFHIPWATKQHDKTLPILRVTVRELKNGEKSIYWGWWDNKENQFIFVQPARFILGACFEYGIDAEVKRGSGKDHNVAIDELEELNPKDVKL